MKSLRLAIGWSGVLLLALLIPALPGCGGDEDDGLPAIAVSIPPQAWIVERIGRPHVRAITVLRPGESPATYQPSDAEISDILKAEVFLQIGVPFEKGPWLRAIRQSDRVSMVDLRQGMRLRTMEGHAEDDGHDHSREERDPHVWLEPGRLSLLAKSVVKILSETDPAHATAFRAEHEKLRNEMRVLHEEIQRILLPHRGKRVHVFHPSWGYFCDAYGLEQVAIEVEGKDPSEESVSRFLEQARADGVRTIYVQPQIRSTAAETIAKELGAEIRTLDPLEKDVPANLRRVARTLAEGWR